MSESPVPDEALVAWLLAAKTPSIRFFTLRDLLHKPQTDPAVRAARQAMATDGPIPQILARQTEAGHWDSDASYYTPKYRSTHWSMLLLVELGVNPEDSRFQRGIDYMLSATQSYREAHLNNSHYGFLCLWANILRYTAYGGRLDDPHAVHLLACIQRQAGEMAWRCPMNHGLACAWGAARTLWALAALPPDARDQAINSAIESGLTFLLDSYSLVQADYPTPGSVHKLWHTLNFPLFYQADILFTLRVAAAFGRLSHPGAQHALAWLRERRHGNGRWQGSSPYRSRSWSVGAREDTDRWVTLEALRILQAV